MVGDLVDRSEGLRERLEAIGQRGWGQPMYLDVGIAAIGKRVRKHVWQAAVLIDRSQQPQLGSILWRQAVDRLHRDGGHAEALAKRCDFLSNGRIAGPVQFQRQIRLLAEQPGQRAGIAQGCVPVACSQTPFDPAAASARQANEPISVRLERIPGQALRGQRRLIEFQRIDIVGQLDPQEDAAFGVLEFCRRSGAAVISFGGDSGSIMRIATKGILATG